MSNLIKFWLIFAANLTANIFIKCEPDWSYDLVSIDAENNTPHKVFVDFVLTRPERGVFAFSGVVDLKQDVPNSILIRFDVFYSLTGSNYIRTPFHMPEVDLENFMNIYYKDLIMESLLNCTDQAPHVDDEFVAPLMKRTINFDDCNLSNKNMPSKLKNGYYKVILSYRHFAEGKVEILMNVFNDV